MAKSSPSLPSVTAAPVVEPATVTSDPAVAPVDQVEAAPVVEVLSESLALIVAEPAPGVRRWIYDVTDDGRVHASDNRESVTPMNPNRAKALIKAARKVFPNAEIIMVLVE